MTRNIISLVMVAAAAATPLNAQDPRGLAAGATVQGYSFAEGFGAKSAMLLITPVGLTLPMTRQLTLDLYSAYARGAVKIGNTTSTLQGVVDTRVRASLAATPWAVLSLGVNLPTGNATHDDEEAIVAAALSTELLGFREALWGTGFGFTTGVATASRFGNTGLGFGASYRLAGEFKPSSTQSITYAPGNEARVRVALDQTLGSSKLTLGVTFQNYSEDQLNSGALRNLFAPGNRWRGDLSYSFRAGPASTWTLFFADILRENGDVTQPLVNGSGAQVGDSTFRAGQQNLAVFGIAGGVKAGPLNLRPSADARMITRERGDGEGWLAGAGTDIVLRKGRTDVIPNLRFSYGKIEGAADEKFGFWGGEVGLTLRWGGQ